MSDNKKTKDQLIEELAALRSQMAALTAESSGEGLKQAKDISVSNERLLNTIIEEAPT
jgi:hypothetical protein